MRKVIAALTAAAVVGASAPAWAESPGLGDIAGHWARGYVKSGVSAGYIAGYPDGSFRPDRTITRAEFFKLLTAALRRSSSQRPTGFLDTRHWAFEQGHIQAAVGAGLLFPPDYGATLSPDAEITRREIVLAAVRALGKQALVDEKNPVLNAADAASYQPWLKGWAAVAVAGGIVGGYPDGSLGLNRTATRAEALVMVQRILEQVTMDLTPFETAYRQGLVRHPGEAEPYWSFQGEVTLRPTITNGKEPYTFTADAWGLHLMAAPGNALWVSYVVSGTAGGTQGVVARLSGGKLSEVARFENRSARLLDVAENGRLWFSDGQEKLIAADARGEMTAFDGVKAELGELDLQGNLWVFGTRDSRFWTLTRVSPAGEVTKYEGENKLRESVAHMAAAEDGSVWLIVTLWNEGAGFLQARQYVAGKEVRRLPLLNRYQVGGEYAGAAVVGRSGPFLWVAPKVKVDPYTAHTGLYRLDLTTGAFVPQVAPRSVAASFAAMAAPGSGALIKDKAGQFWRILP